MLKNIHLQFLIKFIDAADVSEDFKKKKVILFSRLNLLFCFNIQNRFHEKAFLFSSNKIAEEEGSEMFHTADESDHSLGLHNSRDPQMVELFRFSGFLRFDRFGERLIKST